jgi:hypothetical protein
MALRRPPTRVELKTEDIEEYHQVRRVLTSFEYEVVWTIQRTHFLCLIYLMLQIQREKEMEMVDSNASTPTAALGSRRTTGHTKAMNAMERKQEAADRIGISRPRPP